MMNIKKHLILTVTICFSTLLVTFISCKSTEIDPAVVEENEIAIEEEIIPESNEVDQEYLRSIGSLDVSKDTFEQDKAKILRLISELSVIMQEYNYKPWLTYLDAQSIEYWSKTANLRKAQNRLPVKGLQLRNMEDYFKYVFVPARTGHTVKEIRYESDVLVKVVDIEDDQDIIYYYFQKVDGVWMLHLPPMGQ